MKVAIVGSRDYPGKCLVHDYVRQLPAGTVIVSGGARGVDTWAVEAARFFGLETKIFRADWEHLGKSAGFRRNAEIVDYADQVVAFWDGKSRGTKHTIELARKAGKLQAVYGEPN